MDAHTPARGHGPIRPGPVELKDIALVIVLLAMLLAPRWPSWPLRGIAMAAVLIGLLVPRLLTPIAVAWFGLAAGLGRVMPPVVMGAIFFVLVLPLARLRRLFSGEHVLRTAEFRNGTGSVFVDRPHVYGPADFERQF
jgi:hypothetical protein